MELSQQLYKGIVFFFLMFAQIMHYQLYGFQLSNKGGLKEFLLVEVPKTLSYLLALVWCWFCSTYISGAYFETVKRGI